MKYTELSTPPGVVFPISSALARNADFSCDGVETRMGCRERMGCSLWSFCTVVLVMVASAAGVDMARVVVGFRTGVIPTFSDFNQLSKDEQKKLQTGESSNVTFVLVGDLSSNSECLVHGAPLPVLVFPAINI